MTTPFIAGWRRQPLDHRDYRFVVPKSITDVLPPSIDLSANMGPNLDQGSLGSCGPNTADECIAYDQKAESLSVGSSRLFTYYNTRAIMGTINQDSGVDNRSMLKALNQYGFCAETTWPYTIAQFKTKPPQAAYDEASGNKIDNYAAVIQSLSQMKGCLVTGRPFIFGFDVFDSMLSDLVAQTGIVPDPGGMVAGGHDVTIFAYDDNGFGGRIQGGCFKFRNHWAGPNNGWWGDNDCGYISYNYATSQYASDFWVVNAIPQNPQPSPSPAPSPPVPKKPCRRLYRAGYEFGQAVVDVTCSLFAKHFGEER